MYKKICKENFVMSENSASLVAQQVIILLFVMICGIYARKRKFIDEKATGYLSALLINVAQPCLFITSFQVSFDMKLLDTALNVTLASVIIHVALIVLCLFIYNFIRDKKQRKIYRFASIFGNCGFLGFPVLNAMYGDIGVFYGAFFTMVFNIIAWSYGVFLMTSGTDGKRFDAAKLKNIINPGTVSTVAGIILFALRIEIPSPLIDGIDMVGDMTFPLSMLIVGSLIAETDFKRIFKNPYIYCFCFVKLLLTPFIALIICKVFGVDTMVLAPLTIVMAGVPTATITAPMAEMYGEDAKLSAELIGISTILSVGTIPLMIYLAGIIL